MPPAEPDGQARLNAGIEVDPLKGALLRRLRLHRKIDIFARDTERILLSEKRSKSSMRKTTRAVLIGCLWISAHASWAAEVYPASPQTVPGDQPDDSALTEPPPQYRDADDDALKAAQQGEWLANYRAMFLNGTTAGDMEAFIARYKDADPEKLVPRARIRMRTFAAYEAATKAYQCNKAKRLHQRISGYKVTLPFSYASCMREKSLHATDPAAMYVAGVRLEDDGEHANARTLFRAILDRFPRHPVAVKAADRLARIAELETLDMPRRGDRNTKASACPKDLGYIRSRMVYSELRGNPSFDEPIEGIIRKAGGLDAAIAELERLIRENRRPLNQAAFAVRQYTQAEQGDDSLAFRCERPEGGYCSANYYYHLLKEGEFYYTELLNSLRCRKTGVMEHAAYTPAPIRKRGLPQFPAAGAHHPELNKP